MNNNSTTIGNVTVELVRQSNPVRVHVADRGKLDPEQVLYLSLDDARDVSAALKIVLAQKARLDSR
jgi:hypothetical protein